MAEYRTLFACRLEVGTSSNAERALALYAVMNGTLDGVDGKALGVHLLADPTTVGSLLIRDADGQGEPEEVEAFVLRCAEALDLRGQRGFTWALTCSTRRVDSFGGGARLLDLGARKRLAGIDCEHWRTTLSDPTANLGKTS